jgi:hypothetical protein
LLCRENVAEEEADPKEVSRTPKKRRITANRKYVGGYISEDMED